MFLFQCLDGQLASLGMGGGRAGSPHPAPRGEGALIYLRSARSQVAQDGRCRLATRASPARSPLPRPRRRGGAREGPLDHGKHLQGGPRPRHTAHPHQRGPTDPYAPCGPAAGMSSICFPVRTKTTGDKNSNKKIWGKTRKTFHHGKKTHGNTQHFRENVGDISRL